MHMTVESEENSRIAEILSFIGQLKQSPDGPVLLCSMGRQPSGTYWLKADIPNEET
jgi:hypothetical protein